MGSFSIIHWLILAIILFIPLYFILSSKPTGPNRFGDVPPALSFAEAIASFFRNYATFEGRASRSAYWWVVLFLFIVSVVLNTIDPTEKLDLIFSLGTFIPMIALAARRMHDTNRSGWYQLLAILVPIGTIGFIIWAATPATDGKSIRTASDDR